MRFISFSLICCIAMIFGNLVFAQDQGVEHLALDGKLIAGPHLTGAEYVGLRSDTKHQVIRFDLRSDAASSSDARITIGPDYVVEFSGDGTKIYDFRFRRKLAWGLSSKTMSNDSLFADWQLKWAFFENNLGTLAVTHQLKAIDGSAGDPLIERFYTEQRVGLSHPSAIAYDVFPIPEIDVVMVRDQARLEIDGNFIAKLDDGEVEYPSDAHRRTFAAWLAWSAWSGRAHPTISKLISERQMLPNIYVRLSDEGVFASNETPKSNQTLEFSNPVMQREALDVMQGLLPTPPDWNTRLPKTLGTKMIAAARGEANGGPTKDDEFLSMAKSAIDDARALDVVLLAISPRLACDAETRDRNICAFMFDQLRALMNDPDVQTLFSGLQMDQQGRHAEAAQLLLPLLNRDLQQRSVLELIIANMLVEAKNKGQLKDTDLNTQYDELPVIFERAIDVDPYVPMWYRDFYNYLHSSAGTVNDEYIVRLKAYPVIDIARVLPDRAVPSLVSSISNVEQKIARDFPTYFPTY